MKWMFLAIESPMIYVFGGKGDQKEMRVDWLERTVDVELPPSAPVNRGEE